jgi:hypothetical protein
LTFKEGKRSKGAGGLRRAAGWPLILAMVGGGKGGAGQITLEHTPTWIVAAVCSVIVVISLLFERMLHCLGKVQCVPCRLQGASHYFCCVSTSRKH